MTLFAYIMTDDDGSAPNPFHGVCTLALCMPMTRSKAEVGDYVVGLAGKRLREVREGRDWRIIYAMQVSESMTFEEYRLDTRFRAKRPGKGRIKALGDNVGHAVKGTNRVLIGEKFVYWGREPKLVPVDLRFLRRAFEPRTPGGRPRPRGHWRFTHKIEIEKFRKWFKPLEKKGQLGDPTDMDEPKRKGC